MRKIYTIGETVFDIIFKNGKAIDSTPGGAMLNTSVSLGRLNLPVSIVGDYSSDYIGRIIDAFLDENGVNRKYITKYENAQSRLALAFLDNDNNADYSFYKIRKDKKVTIAYPVTTKDDIILFGSFYGIKSDIRSSLKSFLLNAKENGSIIIYDPNFRKAHLNILPEIYPYIMENIEMADIVKGSDEDFENIFATKTPKDTHAKISKEVKLNNFIYTANKFGVDIVSKNNTSHYSVPGINPISTVGAGDTFNAGLIYGLLKYNITTENINDIEKNIWDKIIKIAIDFSIDVCMSYNNYLSKEFVSKMPTL